jgi:drug/metabolite transporter (DMT)-like permease
MRRVGTSSATVAAAISVLLWSSAFVVIRFAGRELAPGPLALARLLVASVALGAVVAVRRERLPRGRALLAAVAAGLLWFGLYNVALNAAERRIDAGTSALLVNTAPVFVALLAGFALREGLPARLLIGCVVSFAGVGLIAAGVSRHGATSIWGAVLCIVAAVAYAVAMVVQKPALREYSALAVTWVACLVATVACLPFGVELVGEVGRARASDVLWSVYLGVGPSAIGFVAWAFALARTDAGRLGVTTYLVPPLSVLLGWIALGETPPLLALPGGCLCLLGVAVARGLSPRALIRLRTRAAAPVRAGRNTGPRS